MKIISEKLKDTGFLINFFNFKAAKFINYLHYSLLEVKPFANYVSLSRTKPRNISKAKHKRENENQGNIL